MAELQVSFSLPAGQKLRLGYRQAGTTFPFIYISQELTYEDNPYVINNLEEGAYEVEISTSCSSCGATTWGNTQVIRPIALDPNTIYTDVLVDIDSNSNVYISVEFSEIITTSVTLSGYYTIADVQYTYNVIVPSNVKSYNKVINTTTYTTIDNYCYNTISPSTVNNKGFKFNNISKC